METVDSILRFWFGDERNDAEVAKERAALWWKKNPEIDEAIRERFEATLDGAVNEKHDHWLDDPHGRLALIILADQFSRNMYRGTPRAFANDSCALGWCKQGLAVDSHLSLRPIERVFFYLPLEHSESLEDQDRSVELFSELAASVTEDQREPFTGYVDYAVRHRDVIKQFGRFSHRNAILGRESSDAELAFLRQPGSSF